MEGLNNMIKTAKTNRWITGFEVSTNNERSLEVTHLQYADDTLIFCDADEEQLRYLRVILVLFEGMSGLHINWGKSHLYPINMVSNMELLASVLGGEVGALPAIYLGCHWEQNHTPKKFGIMSWRNVRRSWSDGKHNIYQRGAGSL
uniref:Putative ovule protein n=1 Tax=Solanum chacoense TaxID=4108 RepID=A0A0V0HG43_SOLCH